ncbi:bifunctional 3,4-dihydroxy-2-butanone-4-phosphate synthase/GTP cyclohydrolase II [bacterium]|nr:bifunctional 3,4-dihydroxy-2-butanone-4-phosphate synthase/GTP cyclohydrolase II [bacterium]MBU1984465.1 bifunctional 3,4-dihydroxy-2-butanone-4-phosphate synthase/GTP cyclohydrolase II [bacterium]
MLDRVTDALVDIAEGKMIIVVDDEDRENEGDLVQAAEKVTAESVNFMVSHGRGMVCVCMTDERADQLNLPPMVAQNTALKGTAFTVTIDYRHGTTTGISAADRTATIRAVADPATQPSDFARPGHIHPLRARPGGVFERVGQTEAAVDLARLSGLFPAGVVCEIMKNDGTMMRRPELRGFADRHHLKMISVADLLKYRCKREMFIQERVRVKLPTKHGEFTLIHFEDMYQNKDHLALVKGAPPLPEPVLVRAHSECFTGDVLGSQRCDCGWQLDTALERIEREGSGVLVYLRQEGRGIGLGPKLQAYKLQDEGLDTVEANLRLGFRPDLRHYGACAQILRQLGTRVIRLMTNNPRKVEELENLGIRISERIPLEIPITELNRPYLLAKRDKLGHLLLKEH